MDWGPCWVAAAWTGHPVRSARFLTRFSSVGGRSFTKSRSKSKSSIRTRVGLGQRDVLGQRGGLGQNAVPRQTVH